MRLSLKKVCANCVMIAGAVTALSGAAKSVIELVPPGCTMKAEAPKPPPPPMIDAPKRISRGPASVDSQPEPPPTIVYHMESPKKKLYWLGPLVLAVGVALMMLARKLKKEVTQP